MGIKRAYEKLTRAIDVVDRFIDTAYGYLYDIVLVAFAIVILGQPLGAPLLGAFFGIDVTNYLLTGIYTLFAYFIVDHILLTKWGKARREQADRQKEDSE